MTELAIYFSAAVRGGASFAKIAARIDALSALGHVLTEHMASPRTIDLGASDAEIHAHDEALLARAHVMIADVSRPSTGAGYMVARAAARGIPILCLYERGQKPSAMIAGSPDVDTRFFEDEEDFTRQVRAFLASRASRIPKTRAPRVFLAGPPGSGKGTLGAALAAKTGAPHVSTGELLRTLLREKPDHPHAKAISEAMNAGRLVPASIMRDLVCERLLEADCRLFGFILDGYPPSRADLANLTERGIHPDVVLYFDCSDATSVARQVSRAARATDTPEIAKKRLAVFHEAGSDFASLAKDWYPDRLVVRVDAEQPPAGVLAMVEETLRHLFTGARETRSYFAIPPARAADVRSTRLHFHVDAKDVHAIRAIAREIHVRRPCQGQIKIYPIDSLVLGPQHARMPIYRRLPNFHPITSSTTEAFITGRLGDGDPELVAAVLAVAKEHGAMAELEEYVGEWTLSPDGTVTADSEYDLLPTVDLDRYREHRAALAPSIPAWELHHGFDVPKKDPAEAMPIALDDLVAACARAGLDNGGWFVFGDDRRWAYRTNELADGGLPAARARLGAQARALQALLAERGVRVPVGFSLERMHGIWTWT
jgi:adenylate kinase